MERAPKHCRRFDAIYIPEFSTRDILVMMRAMGPSYPITALISFLIKYPFQEVERGIWLVRVSTVQQISDKALTLLTDIATGNVWPYHPVSLRHRAPMSYCAEPEYTMDTHS